MTVIEQFTSAAPAPIMGALDYAKGLMAGDLASFKAGYTAENAYIATVEALRRSNIDVNERTLAECLGVDPSLATLGD